MTFSELLLCSNQNELIYFLPLFLVIFYWIDLRSLETRKQPQIENLVKSTGKRFPSEWSKMLKETLKGQFLFRDIEQITKFSDDQVNKKILTPIGPTVRFCLLLWATMAMSLSELLLRSRIRWSIFYHFLRVLTWFVAIGNGIEERERIRKKITSTTGL